MESSESSKPFKQCLRCKAWSYGSGFHAHAQTADRKDTRCARCNSIRKAHERALRKIKTIDLYGGECGCCGETRTEFLSLDHINGGGGRERMERAAAGLTANNDHHYKRIVAEGSRDPAFRILCHNCNMAHGTFGYCPHEDSDQCAA